VEKVAIQDAQQQGHPVGLPPSFNLFDTIHAANERMPIEAVEFGAKAMFEVIARCGARQP